MALGAALALLSGCASSGSTPLGASLDAILFGGDTGAQAAAVPYASLDARLGDIQGLWVMGAQAGDITYWPGRNGVVLELEQGGLQAFQGLDTQLLGTRYRPAPPWRQASPSPVTVTRQVQNADGDIQRFQAEGTPHCAPARITELPLGKRALEACHLEWHWASGDITTATYWRDPATHRLWASAETPWPDGPDVSWRVARHWW
ncbi:YjbF family lipoprotein [Halomonas getboli]|uniref:YjbF family lipoprotein n=1 Tax=Halomonas getboli TaxID=2935862 RepID=UPI001FFE4CBA|nr:YjbF family lipoprotein [Halomonas getboli]MCK2182989.1 YjbF family lipoprotein [Halomonas getboli]